MKNNLDLICIFIFLTMGLNLSAQRGNVWVFGDSSLIDFNTTIPTTGHSVIKSRGTAASICNSNGSLLFSTSYDTDILFAGVAGGEVYDSAHNLMQNGDNLKYGGWYQEAIIIPNPTDSNKYYIFHIGVTDYYGLYYTEIDLSLNGGLGAVTQKNVLLLNNKANDGLTAVKHGNGRDWWIFFRESTTTQNANNLFYKYLVSPQGISGPFTQPIGTLTAINSYRYFFSKDGTKLGAVGYRGLIETYDLDRCSGQLSNYRILKSDVTVPPVPGVWSGAFSPDGTKLYVATSYDDSYLWQFNLLDSLPQNTVDTLANFNFSIPAGGALKLAPDNKIYWSCAWNDGVTFNYPYPDTSYNVYNTYLSVINSPDSLGAACDFQPYSFYLGGGRTYWGLPNNPNYELGPLVGSVCDTLTVGIAELASYKNNITVYYDAGWQMAFVNAKGLKGKNYTFQLYNLNGQLILQEQGKLNSEYFTKDLSLVGNASGIYLVRLITEKEVLTTKFVK